MNYCEAAPPPPSTDESIEKYLENVAKFKTQTVGTAVRVIFFDIEFIRLTKM